MRIFLFFVLLFLCKATAQGQQDGHRLAGMDKEIEDIMKQYKAVGVSVAIVENGQTIYAKGYGFRDLKQKLPVTSGTVFPIGSITKSFTSALIGMAVDSGKIVINEKPSAYLPGFQFSTDQMNEVVSVEDLLTHKSGLGGLDGTFLMFPAASPTELMKRVQYLVPAAVPKDSWAYSNFGYIVLGAIVEQQAHDSWEHRVKEKIFTPLQMTTSSTGIADMVHSGNYSKGYGLSNGAVKEVLFQKFINDKAVGSISSTAEDMANWIKLWLGKGRFQGKELLSENYIRQATSFKAIINGNPPDSGNKGNFIFGYGYGWNVNSYKGHYRVHHGGAVSGFSSDLVMFPKENLGIIVLTNQHNTDLPYVVCNMIADRLLGLSEGKPYVYSMELHDINIVGKPETRYNQDKKISHELDDYCGNYIHPGYGELTIVREKNVLYAVFPAYKLRLKHQHYDIFELRLIKEISQQFNPEFIFNFRTDDEGHIDAVDTDLQRGGVCFKKK
jgi:CubicO group peptidase (beta-lactamase class C family)